MKIPNFPQKIAPLMSTDGTMHPLVSLAFSQLFTQLQQNVSDEGFVMPLQSPANLALLAPTGAQKIITDSSTGKMNINNFQKFEPISTEPEYLTTAQIAAIPTAQIKGKWVVNTDNNKLFLGIYNVFREIAYT